MAMSPQKSSLEGRDLRRSFGQGSMRSTALAGVSIDLYPGQFSLMMGPSGSGKSTLLAILSGLLRPDHGTVHSLGQNIWAMSERQAEGFRLRHVGFIFQGYNLFGAFNAVQQLELVGRWGMNMGYWEARKKARNILDMLGLSKKKHLRPAATASGRGHHAADRTRHGLSRDARTHRLLRPGRGAGAGKGFPQGGEIPSRQRGEGGRGALLD